MFPVYEEQQRFAMLKRFPFSVVYENQTDRIFVLAVAHSRRREGYWQERT